MPVRITAKSEGFRRCGIEHTCKPITWPDGQFTPQQLKRLQAEPMLVVEVITSAVKPEAPFYRIPDTAEELLIFYSEVKQRLLTLGVDPEAKSDGDMLVTAPALTIKLVDGSDGQTADGAAIAERVMGTAPTAANTQVTDDAGAAAAGVGTDTPADVTVDVKPAKTPVKPALKPGKGK